MFRELSIVRSGPSLSCTTRVRRRPDVPGGCKSSQLGGSPGSALAASATSVIVASDADSAGPPHCSYTIGLIHDWAIRLRNAFDAGQSQGGDVKQIFLSTTASINNGAIRAKITVNPTVVGAGFGYRF